MAHGAPDFFNIGQLATVFAVYDLGELAVRLGSINTYDRRGNVIWLDGLEDGLAQYYTLVAGAGASVAASSTAARNGASSAKLTAGSDGAHYAVIGRYQVLPRLSKIGWELSFSLAADEGQVVLLLDFYDGTLFYNYRLRYTPASNLLEVLDSDGNYDTLSASLDLLTDLHLFHTFKLTVDLEEQAYVRLLVNGLSYDLSSYAPVEGELATSPLLSLQVMYIGALGSNSVAYADDFILTQNEP